MIGMTTRLMRRRLRVGAPAWVDSHRRKIACCEVLDKHWDIRHGGPIWLEAHDRYVAESVVVVITCCRMSDLGYDDLDVCAYIGADCTHTPFYPGLSGPLLTALGWDDECVYKKCRIWVRVMERCDER